MTFEELDKLKELLEDVKISDIMSVMYWNVIRKRKILSEEYPDSSKVRDLLTLANKIDDLETYAITKGE